MAGHWWGGHPMTLYRTYQALIRSITDYGAGIYDPRTKKQWTKLEKIQSEALRICMGAMRSTPTIALRTEAMDMPIRLRHDILMDRLLLRWHSKLEHPTIAILHTWSNKRRRPNYYRPTILRRFEEIPINPQDIERSILPACYATPFEMITIQLQVTLQYPPIQDNMAGKSPPEIYNILRATIWKDYHLLATDGSKIDNYNPVGAAMVDTETQPPYVIMKQLEPSTTVHEAEAQALLQATRYIRDQLQANRIIILTDNQTILRTLSVPNVSPTESTTITEVRKTLYDILSTQREVQLAWVPSHKGIIPNEMADNAANQARGLGTPLQEPQGYRSFFPAITAHHLQTWQNQWNNPIEQPPKGRWTHAIHPILQGKSWLSKAPDAPRKVLAPLARVRLGHTHAPAHLHRINAIPSPLCLCGEIGTAQHLINDCNFIDRTQFLYILQQLKYPEPHRIPEILEKMNIKQRIETSTKAFTALFAANAHLRL